MYNIAYSSLLITSNTLQEAVLPNNWKNLLLIIQDKTISKVLWIDVVQNKLNYEKKIEFLERTQEILLGFTKGDKREQEEYELI